MKPTWINPMGLFSFLRVRTEGATLLRGNTLRPAVLKAGVAFCGGGAGFLFLEVCRG